jgi:hypothetical protein
MNLVIQNIMEDDAGAGPLGNINSVNNKDPKVAEDIKTISNFQAWFYFEK